jgi:hypothetical protein
MDPDQSIVTLPARKEFGADDIALYKKVRIYDNISIFTPEVDDVGSVSNAASEEERGVTLNERWIMRPVPLRPKWNRVLSWFWFCCQCESGGYNLIVGPQFCTAQNCNHVRCYLCRCERHRKGEF